MPHPTQATAHDDTARRHITFLATASGMRFPAPGFRGAPIGMPACPVLHGKRRQATPPA